MPSMGVVGKFGELYEYPVRRLGVYEGFLPRWITVVEANDSKAKTLGGSNRGTDI